MSKVQITILNHSTMRILAEAGIEQELCDQFSFMAPGYKYMPAYKSGKWDGRIELFNRQNKTMGLGLLNKVVQYCKKSNYSIDIVDKPQGDYLQCTNDITPEEFIEYTNALDLTLTPRDYQYAAAYTAIRDKRKILLSPTGSGKSFIIYLILRWYLDYGPEKPALIIVPTTTLVEQMYKDFKDYGFDSESNCHRIYQGKDKNTRKPVVITTWQSVYKLPTTWFDSFGMVVGDEAHTFKAQSLKACMNKCRSAEYRIGTTGTLDNIQVHELILESLFGPVRKVTTTKKLQESNELAQLNIGVFVLDYPPKHRQMVQQLHGLKNVNSYQKEIEFIIGDKKRNAFIRDTALGLKGNTLVLYRFVEKHGDLLYELIKKEHPNTYYVHGNVDTDVREEIRQIMEQEEDAIAVASMGTFSQGINIRNLHNIVAGAPTKSRVKVFQSIGRGLRLADNDQSTTWIDIVDDYSLDGFENYALRHGKIRVEMYEKEEFNVKFYRINLYGE